MDFLSSLNKLFENKKEDENSLDDFLNQRKEAISKFATQLKEQYFMNDNETEEVLQIIKEHFEKIDNYQKNIDYKNYDIKTDINFESGLIKLRYELNQNLKTKINEIMKLKLQKAKDFFNKE